MGTRARRARKAWNASPGRWQGDPGKAVEKTLDRSAGQIDVRSELLMEIAETRSQPITHPLVEAPSPIDARIEEDQPGLPRVQHPQARTRSTKPALAAPPV